MNSDHTPRQTSCPTVPETGNGVARAALVHQLYAQSTITTHVGILAALLLTAAFWGSVEHAFLVSWLIVFLFLQTARYWLVSSFTRTAPQGDEAIRWGSRFIAASAVTQLWWGLSGIVLFPASDIFLQFLLAVFITMVAASVAVAHAAVTTCYVLSVLLTGMPMVVRLFYQGEQTSIILGMVGAVYTIALLGTGRAAHNMMFESIRLRLEKNDLVRELQQSEKDLERRIAERTSQLLEANEQLRHEISERTQAEDRLKMFSLVMEQCHEGIAVADWEGNLIYLNESIARMHGYAREELLGKHLSILHPSDRMTAVNEAIRCTRESGDFIGEIWNIRREGVVFPTLMHCSSLLDSAGSSIGIIGTMSDISELKAVQSSLETEKRKFQALADNAPFGMVMIDRHAGFLYVNQKFSEIFGYELPDIPDGTSWFRLAFPEESQRQAAISTWINDLANEQGNNHAERIFSVRAKGGARKTISFVLVRLHNGDYMITCEDITDRKEAEKRIEQSLALALRLRSESEAANMAKSQFLAMMSHEIRTPLNSIIGFSEMMQDEIPGPLSERQREYIGYVVDNGRHLLLLVNSLLDLSSIETGKLKLNPSPVYISNVLEASVSMVKERAITHDLNLNISISDELSDAPVLADELRLKQILFNLISNAAKFTPDGGKIELAARKNGTKLLVSVKDTGIGILPEDHERIFNAFEQVGCSYARPYQGSGLGLALTKKLVELHRGRIWVQSEGQGKGSTFSFAIPAETDSRGPDPVETELPPSAFAGSRNGR